jgi:chromosome partitioning protein
MSKNVNSSKNGIVISIIQQSGGVGKSTSNFNLSHILASKGMKVLSIENELQSDLMSFYFGRDNKLNIKVPSEVLEIGNKNVNIGNAHSLNLYDRDSIIKPIKIKDNLFFIGSTKHLSKILAAPYDEVVYDYEENIDKLKKQFDIILIDCPPTESNLQKAALLASDYALIPTFLEQKSIGGIAGTIQLINHLKRIKQRSHSDLNVLGIFVTQYSYTSQQNKASSLILEQEYNQKLIELYPDFLLKTRISHSMKMRESSALQQSIVDYAKEDKKASRIASEYESLAVEILNKIKG